MKVTIISVGKLKEKYLKDAVAEYTKRLSKYAKIEIIELQDEKITDNNSLDNVKNKEGSAILKALPSTPKNQYIVALTLDGVQSDSDAFSEFFKSKMTMGVSHIYFIIGGTLGISDIVLSHCHTKMSLSKMTFTHQLVRVILLEQVYRAFKILGNEKYHR